MLFCIHGVPQSKDHKCPKCRKNCEDAGHDLSDSDHQKGNACFWEYFRDIEVRRLTEEDWERIRNKRVA